MIFETSWRCRCGRSNRNVSGSGHIPIVTANGSLLSRPQTTPSTQAARESLVSYVNFLGLEAISLHENGRLGSDWSLLNKHVI